jgi:hypothetical protein
MVREVFCLNYYKGGIYISEFIAKKDEIEEYVSMSVHDYIEKRLDDQIAWYDNKSISAQRKYKRLQGTEIILAAMIPFLSGYADKHWLIPFAISLMGTVVVIIAALTRLGKYHENWIEYRSICELLKHEKYLYLTGTSPYEERNFQLLVQRVESFISSENFNWSQLAASTDEKKKHINR